MTPETAPHSLALVQAPLFATVAPYVRFEVYDRDGGEDARFRIELRTEDMPAPLAEQALALTVPCCECGRQIHPFRQRKGTKHTYVAVACEQEESVRCSRGNAAREAYIAIRAYCVNVEPAPSRQLVLIPGGVDRKTRSQRHRTESEARIARAVEQAKVVEDEARAKLAAHAASLELEVAELMRAQIGLLLQLRDLGEERRELEMSLEAVQAELELAKARCREEQISRRALAEQLERKSRALVWVTRLAVTLLALLLTSVVLWITN